MLADMHRESPMCKGKDIETCFQEARAEIVEYANILSQEAEIENIPSVIIAIVFESAITHLKEPLEFRKYKYIVIDNNKFGKVKNNE